VLTSLPHLLLSWHGGRWIARWGEIKTLVGTDLVRGVLYALLAVFWGHLPPSLAWPALLGVGFLANFASALFNPALYSVPSRLAAPGTLEQLNSLLNSCFSLANVVGPFLAVLLYSRVALVGLLVANSASYFLAALAECRIPLPPLPAGDSGGDPTGSPPGQPSGTWSLIQSHPVVATMLAGFLACNLFLAPLMVFLPLFTKEVYNGDIGLLGGFETAIGVGIAGGTLLLAFWHWEWPLNLKIRGAMLLVALAYLVFVSSHWAPLAIFILVLLGMGIAGTNVVAMTVFQTQVAPENIPVLMGLVNLISVASLPFSLTVVGLLTDRVSILHLGQACGLGLFLATIVVLQRSAIRHLTLPETNLVLPTAAKMETR